MLGLSNEQIRKIEDDFLKVPGKGWREDLDKVLSSCSEEEALCMKFLYGTMPAGDICENTPELYLKAVRCSLQARSEFPWGQSGEMFFNYVLPIRINNEELTDHRQLLYDEIRDRVQGKDYIDAILEVGYWCVEHAVYHSTDDRTASPLGVLRRGFGRCGEESTFASAALRSVGIPCRQVYAPRWAHCDDNHAWVEVWNGEKWCCTGGCEPEEVLDKGWFVDTATRAMLTRARVFSPFVEKEKVVFTKGACSEVNTLSKYAPVKDLKVTVVNGGEPVQGAKVRFQLVNYSELATLAEITTGCDGAAVFETGFGDLYVEILSGDTLCHVKAAADCTDVTVDMAGAENDILKDAEKVKKESLTLTAPRLQHVDLQIMNDEQKAVKAAKMQKADALRDAFARENFFPGKCEIRENAYSNYKEIEAFCQGDEKELEDKIALLKSLRVKDLSDISAETLKGLYDNAKAYKGQVPADLFIPYVACPRVFNEMITDYTGAIQAAFTEEEKKLFREDPTSVLTYIEKNITAADELDYDDVVASPRAVLTSGAAGYQSKRLLFVAILRTLGVPARLNSVDESMEYYADGWKKADGKTPKMGCLKPVFSANLRMMATISLAKLVDGGYQTLHYQEVPEVFELEEGQYRIITSLRGRGGATYSCLYTVKITEGKETILELEIPEEPQDNAETMELASADLVKDGTFEFHDLLGGRRTIMTILEPGFEPTEHFLNEMMEQKDEMAKRTKDIALVVRDAKEMEHPLVKKMMDLTGNVPFLMDGGEAFRMIQNFGTDVRMPLVMFLDEEAKVVHFMTGYNVGTGDQMLNHLGR